MRRLAQKVAVGDNRNGRCAIVRIDAGQLYRVKIGAQQPLGGRRFLDFGNQADAGAAQRRRKVQRRRARRNAFLQRRQRRGGLGGGQFRPLLGNDFFQNAGHTGYLLMIAAADAGLVVAE